ncbi:MAG: CDP-archaeol synthase, partial [Burkholderiales bacterium]
RSEPAMIEPFEILRALLLLGVANGAPIVARRMLGKRFGAPLDAGLVLRDGRPLLGASKTVRGLVAALALTSAVAPLLDLRWSTGLALAAASMAGDLLSSFAKRRIGLRLHAQAFGLDQTPEALLPLWLLREPLGLGWADVAFAVLLFVALEILLSRLLFRLRIREQPY